MARDPYDVLGVPKSASADQIKQAYRKLSKELHPDKHKGDKAAEEKFKEVNKAYEILSDPQKKQAFDQFGEAGVNGGAGFGGGGGGFGGFDFSGFQQQGGRMDFGDIFDTFFGGGGGRRAKPDNQGSDREVEITLTLLEAVQGGERTITVRLLRSCSACKGTGAKEGSKLEICKECGGAGSVTRRSQSFFGMVQQTVICPACHGSGKVPEKKCSSCDGEGRRAEDATITFDIPAGIDDGQRLRLRGQGDAGRQGGPAGDLYVRIRVKEDSRFVRDGADVRSSFSISVPDAVLGTEIQVETVNGPVTLKIPAGTQSGQEFRIKGKGIPVLGSSKHGDHYVTVTVEIPGKISKEEKRLLEEWRALQK